jgi:vitamin-K-epoxide reductase (warfarin-sensitive)
MLRDMRYIIALLAIVGITVSVLALRVHYSTDVQPCSINEHWDCGIVNHSRYAEVRGIPVAALGIAGYAAIGILALLRRVRLVAAAAFLGLAFALYLSHVEANILHTWCLYCVISQVTIAIIAVLSLVEIVRHRRHAAA